MTRRLRGSGAPRPRLAALLATVSATLLTALLPAGALAAQDPAQDPAQGTPQGPVPETPQGPPPRVVGVRVEGEERYTESQIRAALGQRVGDPLDPDVVQRGIETLWKVLHVRAQVEAQPVGAAEPPPGEPLEIELLVTVREQPVDLEPRFIGNRKIEREKLLEWAMIAEQGELFLYQVPRIRQRLLDAYRRDGFYFAEVEEVVRGAAEEGEAPSDVSPDVIFRIREGPRVYVTDFVVHGNESMPDSGALFWRSGLKRLAATELRGRHLFGWFGQKFVAETLEADLVAMRTVYRDRGWLDAVVELDRLDFGDDYSTVVPHVVVDEGRPYTVGSLRIVGVERRKEPGRDEWIEEEAELLFPEEDLLALCQLRPGARWERPRQQEDAKALRDFYGERGYISHPSLRGLDAFEFLDPHVRYDVDAKELHLVYRLAQGRQRFLREVLFAGATHTRDRVLRREVSALPGERADMVAIDQSLARLYNLGYFTDPARPAEHRDPIYRFLATDDPDWVDLEYVVEEGRVVTFDIQGGIDSNDGLIGRLSLSMRNFDITDTPESFWSMFSEIYHKEAFHGAGQRLELEFAPGTVQNQYSVNFFEPDLFRTHFDRYSLDLLWSATDRRYSNYDLERSNRQVKLGRQFGRELAAFVGFTHQDLDVSDLSGPFRDIIQPDESNLPTSLLQEEGESQLFGLLGDLRYSDLDNRIGPRDGQRADWRNAVFLDAAGGDWEFAASEVSYDSFTPVGSTEREIRHNVHLGLNAGVRVPYGATDEVPYTERFFLGGSQTLRGFDFRGVGPNLQNVPLGGETALWGTLEYRIPLYSVVQPGSYRRQEVFRMILFTDWGVLDPDAGELDLDEVRASVGFGFGLSNPLPLIFNFGFPIRKGDGDERETFSFTISFY